MKRLFTLIIFFIFMAKAFLQPVFADIEPTKIMSLHYDNSSSIVFITAKDSTENKDSENIKLVRLSNPNRVYFDISNSVLVGEKQQLVFEKSPIKEIRLAQFETNPNKTVRVVITMEEDFDTSKIKLVQKNGNIIVKISEPNLRNTYFNTVYDDNVKSLAYSSIVANSQCIQKVAIPIKTDSKDSNSVNSDIQKAFENSTLSNADGKTYDSVVSVDISSKLKLRTKYFIQQYSAKNNGLLISGIGQLTGSKMFTLNSPKRAVIDLPNTFLEKSIRNKEIKLCPDGSCSDTAKIGQFEYNKARVVITSDNADKYIPVYSQDAQSLFIINSDKLNHAVMASNIANINKSFVKKIDTKTNEIIFSFSSPVVYSLIRSDNNITFYLFNVKSYNEQDLIKTLNNTAFNSLTLSLLPQIGVKAVMPITKDDIVKVEQSVESKALKLTITKAKVEEVKPVTTEKVEKATKKSNENKNKVVLDAGHGGSDYGAIREGINEKDITLDVTQRIESILKSKGYKVALTRTNDTFVSLEDRVNFSEKECPEIFVSVHVNSAVSTEPSGIETHYYHEYSKELASVVHKHLIKENSSSKDRGLFKSKFYVINHTTVPAILCEIGFISNETERNELISDARKQRTAKAIAEGIIEYLKTTGGKK
jgi:N-acetylmuramoyl-L-alanine amidase